uniref:Uncharacterized protein n=1 Tax=Ditylenchus dipsaci TaxID=166011 RepID=A0A915D6T2_9BILA
MAGGQTAGHEAKEWRGGNLEGNICTTWCSPQMTATTNTAIKQMKHLLLLTVCNLLSFTLHCTATDPVVDLLSPTSTRPDYITFDKWHCGAGDFDKHLSHQLSESECPARMYEANLCCLAHDLCYVEVDKTQEYCDSAFCFCLNRTLSMPNTNYTLGCSNVAEGFCDIVQIFGAAAHSSAQKGLSATSTTSTTSSTTSTTTTPASSTTTTKVSTTTAASAADIVQFVTHNISLHCYSRELGKCLEDLHKCVISHSNQLADPSSQLSSDPLTSIWPACSDHFCKCASAKPVLNTLGYHKKDKQCESSLQIVCSELQPTRPVDSMHVNIQLWTTNVNYLGNGQSINSVITLLLLALLSMLTLVVLLFLIFKCYRRYKAKRSDGYGISAGAAAEFVSRARRHTLRKEENQEPGYITVVGGDAGLESYLQQSALNLLVLAFLALTLTPLASACCCCCDCCCCCCCCPCCCCCGGGGRKKRDLGTVLGVNGQKTTAIAPGSGRPAVDCNRACPAGELTIQGQQKHCEQKPSPNQQDGCLLNKRNKRQLRMANVFRRKSLPTCMLLILLVFFVNSFIVSPVDPLLLKRSVDDDQSITTVSSTSTASPTPTPLDSPPLEDQATTSTTQAPSNSTLPITNLEAAELAIEKLMQRMPADSGLSQSPYQG